MLRNLVLVLLLVVHLQADTCKLAKNPNPLVNDAPTLVKEVPNGQKFIIGDPTNFKGSYLYIANLKGTPYDMGKAYGQLFADEMQKNLNLFYYYYADQLYDILKDRIPKFMAKGIEKGALGLLHRILDLNIKITKRYTNKRYY